MTARTLLAVAGILLTAGCTASAHRSPEPAGATGTPAAGATGEPVATDAPRPPGTDVVLSRVAWDEEAGAVVAGGYVSPVVEDGGTCTLRLEKDGAAVTVTVDALPDATTTVCGGLRTEPGALAGGRWTATLDYRSGTTEGSSSTLPVEVPG